MCLETSADWGVVFRLRGDALEAVAARDETRNSESVRQSAIVRYVFKSGASIVMRDSAEDSRFANAWAADVYRRAIDLYERCGESADPDYWKAIGNLGSCRLALRAYEEFGDAVVGRRAEGAERADQHVVQPHRARRVGVDEHGRCLAVAVGDADLGRLADTVTTLASDGALDPIDASLSASVIEASAAAPVPLALPPCRFP